METNEYPDCCGHLVLSNLRFYGGGDDGEVTKEDKKCFVGEAAYEANILKDGRKSVSWIAVTSSLLTDEVQIAEATILTREFRKKGFTVTRIYLGINPSTGNGLTMFVARKLKKSRRPG